MNQDQWINRIADFVGHLDPADESQRQEYFKTIEQPLYLGAPRAQQQQYFKAVLTEREEPGLSAFMFACDKAGKSAAECRSLAKKNGLITTVERPWNERLPRLEAGKLNWAGSPLWSLVSTYTPEKEAAGRKEYKVEDELGDDLVGDLLRQSLEAERQLEAAKDHVKRWAIAYAAGGVVLLGGGVALGLRLLRSRATTVERRLGSRESRSAA